MNFITALQTITEFFDKRKIPYMVFGGIANSIHGNPRQTFDIDVKVQIDLNTQLSDLLNNHEIYNNIRLLKK